MTSRRAWIATFAVLVAAGAGSLALLRATPEERATHLAAVALRFAEQGEAKAAERYARDAVAACASSPEAQFALGRILAAAGRDEEAIEPLTVAASGGTAAPEATLLLATLHLRQRRYDAALLRAAAALSSAPHAARLLRADVRLAQGDPLGGLEELEAAANEPGAGPATLLRAASLARFLGRRLRSEEIALRATALYRRCADPPAGGRTDPVPRAAALVGLGSADAAFELLATEPGAEAARLRAVALAARGQPEEAERELRDALATESRPVLHAALLRLLVRRWRLDGANAAAQEALRRHPSDPLVRRATLEAAGAWRAARDPRGLLHAALAPEDPLDETWDAWLSESGAPVADRPEARAVRLAARGPDLLASILGDAPGESDAARVEAEIEALTAGESDEPDVLLWRAAFALVRGRPDDARRAAVAATKAAPDWHNALALRALVYVETKETDLAVEDARAAVALRPDRTRFRAVLCRALLAAGDADGSARAARTGLDVEPGDVRLVEALSRAVAAGARSDAAERVALDATLAVARGDLEGAARILAASDVAWHDARVAAVVPALWEVDAFRWAAAESERPEDPEPAIRRAESLARAGQFLHARDVLVAAAARTQSPEVEAHLASLLAALGDLRAAQEILVRVLRAAPASADAKTALARLRLRSGDERGAVALLREVIEAPGPILPRLGAVRLLLVAAEPTDEDVAAVRAWAAGPSGPRDAEAALVEACLALAERRFDDAAAHCARASGAPGAEVVAAHAALRAGRRDEAAANADAARARAPDSEEARAAAVLVHFQNACAALDGGDADRAADSARRAVLGTPLDSLAAALLAVAVDRGARAEEPPTEARALARAAPASPAPLVYLAQLAMLRRDADGAMVHVRKALARWPTDRIALGLFVEAARRVDDLAGAEGACRRALAAGDRSGAADVLLGSLRETRGDDKGALASYLAALDRHPGNVATLRRAGPLLARAGRMEDLRRRIREARSPRGGASRDVLVARWLGAAGDVEGAAAILADAVDAGADGAAAQIEWGRVHLLAGEAAEAARCFEAAIAADPSRPAAYFGLLTALHRQSKGADAERRFAAAAEERPADPVPRTVLGILAEARGDLAAAEEQYRRALVVAPGAAVASNNLAWLLAVRRGKPLEGLPFAEAAARAAPRDPEILDTYAWVLHLAGKGADAVAPAERACRLRPNEAAFHLRRAEVLAGLDRTGAAAEAFATARTLDPEQERAASARLRMAVQRSGR